MLHLLDLGSIIDSTIQILIGPVVIGSITFVGNYIYRKIFNSVTHSITFNSPDPLFTWVQKLLTDKYL